jgi:hypothetical protein
MATATERAIELITHLNDRNYYSVTAGITRQLQALQNSSEGWRVADDLLDHPDLVYKFYGCQTFQVKLNKEGNLLDENASQELLRKLIVRLCEFSEIQGASMIFQKLSQALATYFMQVSSHWSSPIRQAVYCLCARQYIPEDALPDSTRLFEHLLPTSSQIERSILQYCRIFIEDITNASDDDNSRL